VAFHERRERHLIGPVLARQELLNELSLRQVTDDTELEKGVESIPKARARRSAHHLDGLLNVSGLIVRGERVAIPTFSEIFAKFFEGWTSKPAMER